MSRQDEEFRDDIINVDLQTQDTMPAAEETCSDDGSYFEETQDTNKSSLRKAFLKIWNQIVSSGMKIWRS